MDMYATMKAHEERLAALESRPDPGTDGPDVTELRFDFEAALERLSAVEARLDGITDALNPSTDPEHYDPGAVDPFAEPVLEEDI